MSELVFLEDLYYCSCLQKRSGWVIMMNSSDCWALEFLLFSLSAWNGKLTDLFSACFNRIVVCCLGRAACFAGRSKGQETWKYIGSAKNRHNSEHRLTEIARNFFWERHCRSSTSVDCAQATSIVLKRRCENAVQSYDNALLYQDLWKAICSTFLFLKYYF